MCYSKTVTVMLTAFLGHALVRFVTITSPVPWEQVETDDMLEQVFVQGQNDICPQDVRSVSVGDTIVLYGLLYRVEPMGFTHLERPEPQE